MEASGIKFDGSFAGGRYEDSIIEGEGDIIEESFLRGDAPPDSFYEESEDPPTEPSLIRHDPQDPVSFAGEGYSSIPEQDPRRDPTEIFPSSTVTANVNFRTLARQVGPNGNFVEVQNREVTLVREEDTELPTGSRISITEFQSTLPMAFDNDRFFDADDGYQDLLKLASKEMKNLTDNWSEPSMEMGFFGWLWRWCVRVSMSWSRDPINRLRYTRGIQDFLPFQDGFGSFALGGVIRAYDVDDRSHDKFSLNLAFRNRNTSRIMVQMLRRWDWIFHLCTQITWSRFFDFLSRFPFLGWTGFPGTENFPATRDLAVRGIFRMFFEGSWVTRVFTGRQQGIVVFDKHTAAQNLAAESTGFETANRNQHGTFFGREKTQEFRLEHRLSTDESIVRTFQGNPAPTMVNNGVEHVLRCLAKHWRNMLYQENGNFAHQRMEQLNPFEILRFHMPVVLTTLANLRGRNTWDTKVLGPFVKQLQHLNPEHIKRRVGGQPDAENPGGDIAEIEGPCRAGQGLVKQLKDNIVTKVCGGIPSRIEPFNLWLDAIHDAFDALSREAEVLRDFVASVDTGIKLGYQLLKLVDWSVPSEGTLRKAVIDHIEGKKFNSDFLTNSAVIRALAKLAPKDERTLKELVKLGHRNIEAGRLLLGRACTLLERELRRIALDDRIIKLSKGPPTTAAELERHKWYWLDTDDGSKVVVYKSLHGSSVRLVDVETQIEEMHDMGPSLRLRQYIPIAEAISRAQKAFMIIETDYGKKFQYNAFMEFGSTESGSSMRTRLRRLVTLAEVFSPELDKARLNVLSEIKQSVQRTRRSKRFEQSRLVPNCKPQNVTVLGGGPTGLLAGIHCLQNVIQTGGKVKMFEKRDAFEQEGSNFERAQIVRLDSRQIAMLRYHLGTGFEDVYIPAKGETDAHMGNVLPLQGFVEVTIKRLESMILDEVVNLRSKGLLYFYSGASIDYDVAAGTFDKLGKALKEDDLMFDPTDKSKTIMEVRDFVYKSRVTADHMMVGQDYDIVLPRETIPRKFRLVEMNTQSDWYVFNAHDPSFKDVTGSFSGLPPVYMGGEGRAEPTGIIVDVNGTRRELDYDEVKEKTFRMDFSRTHVIVGIGKSEKSPSHLYVTTEEPYAVCCIEGIKIAMGMHNFGEKRWGSGFIDDIRSHSDQNTRIIGDFTKSVVLPNIVVRMARKLHEDNVWIKHFSQLPSDLGDSVPGLHATLCQQIEIFCKVKFRRMRLQTRFFELGNNYYLGMEFPREYEDWKNSTLELVAPPKAKHSPDGPKAVRNKFRKTLYNHLDRLWYESCMEIIKEGDVYNPGGRGQIPNLYTIDSPFEQKLGELKELEAFRLFTQNFRVHVHDGHGSTQIASASDLTTFAVPTKTYVEEIRTKRKKELGELAAGDTFKPVDIFEVVKKGVRTSIVRNSRGYIAIMSNNVKVGRCSDLARSPNGYTESFVALSAFPVAHVVSHRTVRINPVSGKGGDDGFMTTYVGDAQASPHFMRYSGLTGACINCMSINNLVGQALTGSTFQDRIQRYAFETNWSNGEVVQRGTGHNYGQDGFLRPGFPYRKGIDYLYARVLEHYELGADTDSVLSRDWKIKIAAAIVPRGLENDGVFCDALLDQLEIVIASKFEDEVKLALGQDELSAGVKTLVSNEMMELKRQWRRTPEGAPGGNLPRVSDTEATVVSHVSGLIKSLMINLTLAIDYASQLRLENRRISSERWNQPNSVDSVIDDFAVEAQNFANALTQSAALAAAAVAINLSNTDGAMIASALLGAWNIWVSFGTMTNVSRYKNRNEEMRRKIADEKMERVKMGVFSLMTGSQRERVPLADNPFASSLDSLVKKFLYHCKYYNQEESKISEFEQFYERYRASRKDEALTFQFMQGIVGHYIPAVFYVNSYLQEDLVDVYKSLHETLSLIQQAPSQGIKGADAVFSELVAFDKVLKTTIRRGQIRYGFLRDGDWFHFLPETIRFILGPCLFKATIAGKTKSVLKSVESLKVPGVNEKVLSRPIRDLTELYYATTESQTGSVMFLSGFVVFCFSIFFTIFRVIEAVSGADWAETAVAAASWASLGTLMGSTVAVFHFSRKLGHLFGLDSVLGVSRSDSRIRLVRFVTRTQTLLVVVRLLAVLAAAVALPWSLIVGPQAIDPTAEEIVSNPALDRKYPQYIALGSFGAAVAAAIFFFIVEFLIRYNFDPCIGQAVCEPLRSRIEQIRETFENNTLVEIETEQVLQKEAWEYTARQFLHEYRFDTVFAADRFGTILQHLQSGNKPKSQEKQDKNQAGA